MGYSFFLYILLAILPSYIWLLFFLREDKNPEPNLRVLKIFLLGILSTIPVFLIERYSLNILEKIALFPPLTLFLRFFVAIALVEELFKYLVVRIGVLRKPDFDEPIDAPLYMMVAALGFAAAENILVFSSQEFEIFYGPYLLAMARFLGATLLHALCAGILGYFLAISFWKIKRRKLFFGLGLTSATLLHGFYNFFIMKTEGLVQIFGPVILLAGTIFIIFLAFKKLKKIKSVCLFELPSVT